MKQLSDTQPSVIIRKHEKKLTCALEYLSLRCAMRLFSSAKAACQLLCASRLSCSSSEVNRMVSVYPVTCTISR